MLTKMAALRITILALIALSAIHPSGGQVLTLPALNQESLPNTNFSCIGKVIGGYYADVFTGCQMFHVCTLDEKGEIHDYKFGCILGTVFDQETRVCERTDEVNCSESESFFHLNDELYGPGVIPPTADTAATSSAATVKVLDPAVALLAATISPPASTDTSTGPPPSAPANPSPVSSVAAAAPHLSSQLIPTSSPPPPAIPQGVTASSDSSTSRMSTSTSSSVTSAYSFPPLPFTVSRTSTSVSASSRVRIETPLVQISLNQGIDLPAPHLRPSLLRLAAQSQNAAAAAQNFEDLNPTSPSPIRSRTPADFEDVPRDVPRLSHAHSSFRTVDVNPHSIVSSRQKRQTTPTRGRTFRRNRLFSTTDISETIASPSGESPVTPAPDINNQPITLTDSSFTRTSSRGRNRFRSPAPTPVSSSASGNPLRGSTNVQNILVDNTPVRQRGRASRIRQNDNNTRLQSRVQEQSIKAQPRRRPGSSNSRRRQEIPSTANQLDLSVQSQQDSPIEKTFQSQPSQPVSRVSFVRPQAPPQVVTNRPLTHNRPVLRAGSEVRNPDFSKPATPDTFTKTLTRTVAPIVRFDPLPLNDPTPLPPTVLTAELPPDSVHRVSEGATSGTNFPTTTQTAFVFPETSFLCHDKIPGGLYADVETGCVVFHICSVGPDSSVNDNKFVCGEGTLFDQTSRTCQVASAVDCSRSESLYYLNDRLKGPVFLELEPQLPEQQFDFPRVQSSPSSSSSSSLPDVPSHSRFRRNPEKVVDLCLSQPLGTPLADLTSGCQNYMICESRGDGSIFESHHSCKKDYLFSQIRKRCLPSKKVNCVKETLSGILGLDSSKRSISKKRVTRSLLLHRLRRAALPPLVNVVTNAGTEEDARVRRALYSLAILQRWALENARDTTFIEVYSLNTKNNIYPKKAYVESHHLNRYGYLQRKKRDNSNSTSAEQSLNGNQTKAEDPVFEPASVTSSSDQGGEKPGELIISPTSTLPHILPTITIPPQTKKPTPANPRQKLRGTIIDGPSTSFNASPTKISLFTLTVNNTGLRTTTVTLPVATVTVTKTVNLGVQTTANPIVNTALPELPQSPVEASTPLPILSSTVTAVDLIGNMTNSTVNPDFHQTGENSTSPTHGLSTSKETVEIITPSAPVLSSTESSAESATSSSPAPSPAPQQDQVTETPVSVATNSVDNTTVSSPNSTVAPTVQSNSTVAPTVQSVPEDITTTPSTTTLQVETAITEASAEIANVTVSTNITTTTLPSITEVVPPSINASTTSLPSDLANNASMTPVTQAPATTISPFTKDNLPETNFTCKGKKLEQFYPDTEANCQVFHYCSPGFQDTQILDLKFLCSGATMFDVVTQKCENKSMVPCGESPKEKTPTTVNITSTSTTTTTTTTTPTTTTTTTTTTTEPPPSPTQASESPPAVVPMPTEKIEVDEKPTTTVFNTTTTTEPPSNDTQASESPPVVVTTPTEQIEDVLVSEKPPTVTNTTIVTNITTEPHHHNWNATSESPLVHNKTNTTIAEAETLKPASNLPQTSENPPVVVTTPEGQIEVVLDTEKPPTTVSNTTTEPHHHNWNATSESPQVHIEESTNQTITEVVSRPPDEQIKVEDVPDVTTAESVTVVSDTEVSTVEIETVTARFPRDETTDSDMTTEFILEEDSPSTELGPMEVKSETMTASPVQASTTISAPPLSPATPLQISNSTISPPALNNTNISVSVLNNTTTEVNKNTNTEAPL